MKGRQLSILDDDERSSAVFSECGTYRYSLRREWDDSKMLLVWCMLNPSKAGADDDDPSVRRVRGFTKREGRYGGFILVNVWALIATDPKDLHAQRSAFEPENLIHIQHAAVGRDVVVAWGARVARGPGLQNVMRILNGCAASIRCLGYTKGGEPRHPLYLRKDTPFERYPGQGS